MSIFGTGYSSVSYEPVPQASRLWALIRQEFTLIFRTKKGMSLYLLCMAYTVVKLVIMYITLAPQTEILSRMADTAGRAVSGFSPYSVAFYNNHSTEGIGLVVFLLLTCVVSVRAIAGDRAVNALEFYWTRGISPWGYFTAKWLGSALLLGSVFVGGPLLLWLFGSLWAPDLTYLEQTWEFMPQVLLSLMLKCLLLSFFAVGFSALSAAPNVAMFLWLILILSTEMLGNVLTEVVRQVQRNSPMSSISEIPWYKLISPWEAVTRIEVYFAGDVPGPSDVEDSRVWIAWLVLGLLAVFLLQRLRRFLRTSEAVA